MRLINKGKKRSETSINSKIKNTNSDFVNYATHFNRRTILTKNGELMQIIRITGLENQEDDSASLRDKIRDAVYDNLKENNNFAFWFHTIRRQKNVISKANLAKNDNYLYSQINNQWNESNDWENQYVNELYISIISQSPSHSSNSEKKSILSSFSHSSYSKNHTLSLKNIEEELSYITNKINIELSPSGSKILGITKWNNEYYSEPLRFLGKIINLEEKHYPLTFNDISKDLANSPIVFGNRDIQVVNSNKSHFCSILSLKEYIEVPLELMDKVLNLNFEFIITQSFDLFQDDQQLKNYNDNLEILNISQDKALIEISNLSSYDDIANKKNIDFGSLQTTITIITDKFENLENEVSSALEKFGDLGLIMVREDVFLEHCFWSRLPGNFQFLKRQKTIKTLRVPGFSAINSFPSGSYNGNQWGPSVTTLNTIIDTPYFFNFHTLDSGNTIICGPNRTDQNIFINFLICQSYQLDCNIYFIDSTSSSKALTKCLGGSYYELQPNSKEEEKLKLNPFSLDHNQKNLEFITELVETMTAFLKGANVEEEIANAKDILSRSLQDKQSNLLTTVDSLRTNETKNLYEKLKLWTNDKLSYVFGSQDEINWDNKITGIDTSTVINQKPLAIAVFKYLIYRILERAKNSGKPAIIVIDEPTEFMNNKMLDQSFLDMCKSSFLSNSIMILKHSTQNSAKNDKLSKSFFENCDTQIIMPPEAEGSSYNPEIYNLDESEIDALNYMAINNQKNILLKKEDIPIIIKNNTDCFSDYHDILSCDTITKVSIDEIIKNNPQITENSERLVKEVVNIGKEIKKMKQESAEAEIKTKIKSENIGSSEE